MLNNNIVRIQTLCIFVKAGVLIAITFLFVNSCTQFKIIRYGFPEIDDHKIFTNDTIKKGKVEYLIPKQLQLSKYIDTIQLKSPISNRLLSLPEYLKQTNTKAFLIIHNDTLVCEKYFDGYSRSTIQCTFSVTKSITSMIAGVALAEYPQLQLDEPITSYIPELKNKNPLFSHLKMQHLFEMKSGLSYSTYKNITNVFCDNNMIYYTNNQKKHISKSGFKSPPGSQRQYKTYDPVMIAWAIENVSKQKMADYFSNKIWKKIGAENDALWSTDDKNGLVKASSSFHCTAIDLAKLGLLYLHEGSLKGSEIVPKEWITKTVGIQNLTRKNSKKSLINNYWKPSQDYFWWFSTIEPLGDYYADGFKGQFLYVNPNTNTIIVKFSDVSDEFHDMPFRRISQAIKDFKLK